MNLTYIMRDEAVAIGITQLKHLATHFLQVHTAHEAHVLAVDGAGAATAHTQRGLHARLG